MHTYVYAEDQFKTSSLFLKSQLAHFKTIQRVCVCSRPVLKLSGCHPEPSIPIKSCKKKQ